MRKSQVTLEYIMLISIIVLALVGMAAYITRSVSGKWREAADSIGFGRQFDAHTTCCPTCKIKCAEVPPAEPPEPEPPEPPEPEPPEPPEPEPPGLLSP